MRLRDTSLHQIWPKTVGPFFGSILGTLNHIFVGDIIWLKRFATHPFCLNSLREVAELQNPTRLDQILFNDLGSLSEQRIWLDRQIINWIAELSEGDLDIGVTDLLAQIPEETGV